MTTLLSGSNRPEIFNGPRFRVAGPPGETKHHWAGAPNAIVVNEELYVAFRYRLPISEGRGASTVIAKLIDPDRMTFEEVLTIEKADFEHDWGPTEPRFRKIDSFERPALVYNEGRWQLWTCTALPFSTNGKDWCTQIQEADTIEGLKTARPRIVFGGNNDIAFKDPVVLLIGKTYYAWMCCHPLSPRVPLNQEDANYSQLYVSDDTFSWKPVHGADIKPRPKTPFSHGTRVAGVVPAGPNDVLLFVDGKASSKENCEERTFLWRGPLLGPYEPVSNKVIGQSDDEEAPGLRYATVAGDYLLYELSSRLGHSLEGQRHSPAELVMSLVAG